MTTNVHRLLVIGGKGYVGSKIVELAVQKGMHVRSLNPSGKPDWNDASWIERVEWHQGSVFNDADLSQALVGRTAIVSTIGAFGTREHMEKLCGDATIEALKAAEESGIQRFVFISSARVGLPIAEWNPIYGYFHGKQRAEDALSSSFPHTGFSLRPGFIYGRRRTSANINIPLDFLGAPLSMASRNLGFLSSWISQIPIIGTEMYAAVPVDAVAKAAILCATGKANCSNILDTTGIMDISESFHRIFD